jgi:hypothetical protein
MPRKITACPVHFCKGCGKLLVPHVHPSGEIENSWAFARRQHCNSRCYGKALEASNPTPSIPAGRKRAQKRFQGDKCAECDRVDVHLHRHHIDRNPNNNTPDNIRILCGSCHQKLHWREGDHAKRVEQMRGRQPIWLRGQTAQHRKRDVYGRFV